MLPDPTRLVILRTPMVGGELSIGQIVDRTGRNPANVSRHLKQLAEVRLVAQRRLGLPVFYCLDDPVVEKIRHLVCESVFAEIEEQPERQRTLFKKKKRP